MWQLIVRVGYNELNFKIKKLSDAVGLIEAVNESIVPERNSDKVSYSLVFVEREGKHEEA